MRQVSYHMDKICSSQVNSQNVSRGENAFATGEKPSEFYHDSDDHLCANVLIENVNDFQNITDSQASWIGT